MVGAVVGDVVQGEGVGSPGAEENEERKQRKNTNILSYDNSDLPTPPLPTLTKQPTEFDKLALTSTNELASGRS